MDGLHTIATSDMRRQSGFPLLLLIASMMLCSSSDAFSPSHGYAKQRRLSSTTTTNREPAKSVTSTSASISAYTKGTTIEGPPTETKPDYATIHGPLGPLVDNIFMSLFRIKLAEKINTESKLPLTDFRGIIELTSSMNSQYNNRTQVQETAQEVLVSLFPKFILDRYPSWFAEPFPVFSAKMCAWATVVGGTWLMGECEVNDVPEMENGGKNQGVLVQMCRFLEESQCASTCVNSCKIPTQNFFRQNLGLPLTMTPDYETGECQFAFGKLPTEEEEREAREVPCLMRCPSSGGMRRWHDGNEGGQWLDDLEALANTNAQKDSSTVGSICSLMED